MYDPITAPVRCRFHPDRPAVNCCYPCRAPICGTCTTHRNQVPLCPDCILDRSVLKRNTEVESHLQAIGILDQIAALAGVVLGVTLLITSPAGPASRPGWLSLAIALTLAIQGRALRRYHRLAHPVQVVLGAGALGAPLLSGGLAHLGGAISIAFLGGFSLFVLLGETGRECFRPYYREEIESSPEPVRPSYLLLIALLLGAIEIFVRATIP